MVSFILAQASGDEPKYLLFLFAWLLGGAIGGYLADRKGYGEKIGIVTGLCLSAIGGVVWLVVPPRATSDWNLKGPLGAERVEETGVNLESADYWRRVVAVFIDGLILTAAAACVLVIIGLIGSLSTVTAIVVAYVVILVGSLLYAPLLMARSGDANGQTLGKQAMNIRVCTRLGGPMSFGWSAVREVVYKQFVFGTLGAALFLPWLLNVLWPLWDKDGRALHDICSGTRVIPSALRNAVGSQRPDTGLPAVDGSAPSEPQK